MKRIILMATLCAAAASLAAGIRSSYTSPKWVMGGAARSSASVLATTAALAFPDMKLVDVQELLSHGYVFGAWQCGTSMIRRALQAKQLDGAVGPDAHHRGRHAAGRHAAVDDDVGGKANVG